MKYIILILSLMTMTDTASASGWDDILAGIIAAQGQGSTERRGDWNHGPGYGGGYGHGGYGAPIQCSATDTGWEEHWGGHSSCQECLRKHDGCNETCERIEIYYSCQFEGQDRNGNRQTFMGEDYDARAAQYSAENQCYRSGYNSCRYVGCSTKQNSTVVSRRSCRK